MTTHQLKSPTPPPMFWRKAPSWRQPSSSQPCCPELLRIDFTTRHVFVASVTGVSLSDDVLSWQFNARSTALRHHVDMDAGCADSFQTRLEPTGMHWKVVEDVVGGVSHFCRSLHAQDCYGWGTLVKALAFFYFRLLFHADVSHLFQKLVAIRFGVELALRCHWPRRTTSIVNPKHSMWTVWLRFVVSTRRQSLRHCDGQTFSESSGLFTWLRVRVCPTSCSCIRYEFDSLVEYRVWLGTRRRLSSRWKVAVLGTLVAMKSAPFGSKEVGPTSSDISWEHAYCWCVGVESLLQDGGLYSPIPGFRTVPCEKTLVSCLWHFDCFISRERRVQAYRRCIVFYLVLTLSFFLWSLVQHQLFLYRLHFSIAQLEARELEPPQIGDFV